MNSKVRPIPDGYHTLTAYLTVRGAADAIDFYKKAFGVETLDKWTKADFETVARLRDMTARLQKGESINDIIKSA